MSRTVIMEWASQTSQLDLQVNNPIEQSIAMEPYSEGKFESRDLHSDGPPGGWIWNSKANCIPADLPFSTSQPPKEWISNPQDCNPFLTGVLNQPGSSCYLKTSPCTSPKNGHAPLLRAAKHHHCKNVHAPPLQQQYTCELDLHWLVMKLYSWVQWVWSTNPFCPNSDNWSLNEENPSTRLSIKKGPVQH